MLDLLYLQIGRVKIGKRNACDGKAKGMEKCRHMDGEGVGV